MTAEVVDFLPLARRLALVRCTGCGAEWEDIEAAVLPDCPDTAGCPRGCQQLPKPVYVQINGHWRRLPQLETA